MPGIMATDVNTATVVPTCRFNLVQTKIVKSALNVYVKADWSPKIKVKSTANNASITVAGNLL